MKTLTVIHRALRGVLFGVYLMDSVFMALIQILMLYVLAPCFASMDEDFFIVLRQMFESRPELSYLLRVKDSKIPLMRFKYDGISIDLLYAQLKVMSVPDNVDILNPFVLANIDETSWKCLSGGRANMQILQLVLNCRSQFRAFHRNEVPVSVVVPSIVG